MDFKIIDGKEYVTINSFAKEFGIGHQSLRRNMENKGIELFHNRNSQYIKKEFFEEAVSEAEQIIGFREIVEALVKKLNSKVNMKSVLHLNKLITYVSGNNFFGVQCISSPVYKIYGSLNFYIHKNNREILENEIREYLLLYNKPYDVKINILCNDTAFAGKETTVKFIKEYVNFVDKRALSSFVETVNFLRLTSVKDLTLYSDDEMSVYAIFASKEMTKAGFTNLIGLFTYMQKNVMCKSDTVITYNNEPEKRDRTPYPAEIYLTVAYMVFNKEYWETSDMIYKAIKNERHAKIWLLHAMHYVCDWRKIDIIERIPRITIERSPEQTLKDIEAGIIKEEQYKSVSNEIGLRINYKPADPSKTKRHRNTPHLRLHIPESFSAVIGMLAMACEAHNQINGNNNALCYLKSLSAKDCCKFFGDGYNNLFNGYRMSNPRANKAHMIMLSDKGDELGTDGYLIASFARSHTGGINKISDVTTKYLQAKMDGYSVDEITKVLFERGVCSFVPYLFCKFLKKEEFEKASIKDQTLVMNNLPVKPIDIENLLKIDDKIVISIKQKVAEIIKWADEENVSDLVRKALVSIVNGECIGKNEGVYCLRKACGKECSEKIRETCVGCGSEMYVKTFLMELRNEIKFQEHSLDVAKTKGEKIKRTAILEKKLYPTVFEVLSAIKYVYRQDIEDFKKLFWGDDKNGNVRIGW